MLNQERPAILSLAAIMAFRMLGLFMILPVFAVAAEQIPGATPWLVGIALGIYGLTQAILQIPFGSLSDRIGRKPIIITGLMLFIAGSVVAALSHSITWLIIGRALQGAGAIGSTVLATVADLTRDENRSKAMAMMGLCIGFAFTLAMVLGPMINAVWHLSGIFWVTAILALAGILLTLTVVPTPPKLVVHDDVEAEPKRLATILKNPQLLRLDFGIFSLHAMLTALFLAVPILLTKTMHLTEWHQVSLYLIVLILAFIGAVPMIILAERKRAMKQYLLSMIAVLIATQLLMLTFHHSTFFVSLLLLIFFTAFTFLEASLPSIISKVSPIRNKGTAMGIYSSSQFFGIFAGGALGGLIFSQFNLAGIFIFTSILGFLWLISNLKLEQPPYLSTLIFKAPDQALENPQIFSQKLRALAGIGEVAIMPNEALIYLKVDKKIIEKHELRKRIEEGNLA